MKKLIVSLGLALTLSFGATFNEGVEAFVEISHQCFHPFHK